MDACPLVCPHCRSALRECHGRWFCLGCGSSFRSLRGIPDLRLADDLFMPNSRDWEFALRLAEDFDRRDFRGLLDRYFDLSPEIPADLRRRQIGHILSAPDRSRQWLAAMGGPTPEPILDLGCGTGSFSAAVGHGAPQVWGIDIAMRWLIVARKRLDEAGLSAVRLVCGEAERLPFREEIFSRVVAGDVFEHVSDQHATLHEAHRVLRPGGRVFLASPNRYSLAPEPHVQVWGVGYLPRRWMPAYVRRLSGVEFRAIRTLGLDEWRQLLAKSPFRSGIIRAPGLPGGDFAHFGPVKRRLARLYNRVVSGRLGQVLAQRFGPLFHVVCTRQAGVVPSSSRSTRRRSRPPVAPA